MKIPNPFFVVWRIMSWPFAQLFFLLVRSIRVQVWILKKMAAAGCQQEPLDNLAKAFNALNVSNGRPTFALPEKPDAVEKAQSEQAEKQSEAKT